MNSKFFVFGIILLLLVTSSSVYIDYFSKEIEALGQYFDIAQIMADKFVFEIGDQTFDVYYGYKGSLDSMGSEFVEPTLSSMNINEERKSIEITVDKVPEKTDFWVRIPQEMLYAENENFVVLVDGKDTKYDLIKYPKDYVVGFVISETTKNIEIVGTKIVPEFGVFSILVLGISVLGIIVFMRRSLFVNYWANQS